MGYNDFEINFMDVFVHVFPDYQGVNDLPEDYDENPIYDYVYDIYERAFVVVRNRDIETLYISDSSDEGGDWNYHWPIITTTGNNSR